MKDTTSLNLAPFDAALNMAVIVMSQRFTPDFTVAADAPSSFTALRDLLDSGQPLVVAAEGSDATIFGVPEVNFAFRAWHDWCHWFGDYDFSLSGEAATCSLQIEHLRRYYGVNKKTDIWVRLLVAEVIGQREYYERYGRFIEDQRSFVSAYLKDKTAALSQQW